MVYFWAVGIYALKSNKTFRNILFHLKKSINQPWFAQNRILFILLPVCWGDLSPCMYTSVCYFSPWWASNFWLLSAQRLECCRWLGELTEMPFHCGSIQTFQWQSEWRTVPLAIVLIKWRSQSLLTTSMTTHQSAILLPSGIEALHCLSAALLPQTSVGTRAHQLGSPDLLELEVQMDIHL